jgi:hypothetical protein
MTKNSHSGGDHSLSAAAHRDKPIEKASGRGWGTRCAGTGWSLAYRATARSTGGFSTGACVGLRTSSSRRRLVSAVPPSPKACRRRSRFSRTGATGPSSSSIAPCRRSSTSTGRSSSPPSSRISGAWPRTPTTAPASGSAGWSLATSTSRSCAGPRRMTWSGDSREKFAIRSGKQRRGDLRNPARADVRRGAEPRGRRVSQRHRAKRLLQRGHPVTPGGRTIYAIAMAPPTTGEVSIVSLAGEALAGWTAELLGRAGALQRSQSGRAVRVSLLDGTPRSDGPTAVKFSPPKTSR